MPHPECPERIERVLAGFRRVWPLDLQTVDRGDVAELAALHDPDYLTYLDALCHTLDGSREILPSLFREDMRDAPLTLRAGMYCRELGTPVMAATWEAAVRSASAAGLAAAAVAGGASRALALCRPPGHHAGRRRFGGYCYLNNAYVAATHLAAATGTCAVLDVDYHLGDGSLEFASAETPYVSLHADPWAGYPYLDHHAARNVPHATLLTLAEHTDGDAYLGYLDQALRAVKASGAGAVVVSLGFDTVGGDRIQDIRIALRPEDYRPMGAAIAGLGLPVVVVLEGGYDLETLAQCATEFATGLGTGPASGAGQRRFATE